MLDVHPPEHAAHSWRDFFIHIATIVVGLLIAVGLEQTVEFFHHRHQVAETRERIQSELEMNRQAIHRNMSKLQQDMVQWNQYGLELSQSGLTVDQVAKMNFTWALLLESNSAWENARQGDVFSYIPPQENIEYAYLYRLFAENYATSVLYIADVRTADAIVQRVRATHVLVPGDRERLIALVDSLNGHAKNQLDLYSYLDESLGKWLDKHLMTEVESF